MPRPLLAVLAVLLWPALALGHGEQHGAAAHLLGATVTVQGYQIELLSEPGAPTLEREGRLLARISTANDLEPVTGAGVRMAMAPAGDETEPVAAQEVTWAGTYALPVVPSVTGAHRVRVVVAEVDGRALETPIDVAFDVDVTRAAGVDWFPLATVALVAGLALVAVRLRAAAPAAEHLDLLAVPWLGRVLTARAWQHVLQVSMLVAMAVVVFLGLFDVQDARVNVAPRLTWTIWWAGLIFTLVVAGRVWCVACPFGALNEWTSSLTGAWRRLPRPFRNLWWGIALFVVLTWADEQLDVVRRPAVTAWIVIGLAALAVLVGLRYQRRSFCRYLCPIGGVLGLYAMTAPIELRARDGGVCRGHREKGCYQGAGAGRGCSMFEFPQAMDRNNYCTFCLECARGCARDNLALRLRTFGRDLWATARRALDEAYLTAVLVGLTVVLTARMLSGWPGGISALARWLPPVVRTNFKPLTYLTAVESVVILGSALVVAPLLLLAAAAVADRLAGARAVGVRRTFVTFGYMFVPVALALHLAHNLAHLLEEGPGIVPAVQRAVAVFTPWTIGEPDWQVAALASGPTISVLEVGVVVGFFVLSLVSGHQLSLRVYDDRGAASRALLPFAVLSLLFVAIGIVLLGQPMEMRHGM
jgi:hypothetical protein